MEKKIKRKIDGLMRTIHLYTGLFLVPWVIVYATSGFLLNHKILIAEQFGLGLTRWEVIREVPYTVPYDKSKTGEVKSKEVLQFVDLDGPNWIVDGSNSHEFLISRPALLGDYIISWLPDQSLIIVEQKKPFSLVNLFHFLHFTHGFDQDYFSHIAWSTIVDLIVVSLLFWMVSGIYIWAMRKNKRILGGVILVSGGVIFMGIIIVMCQ